MKILAPFVVAHLNIRKEAAGDETGKTAMDIRLKSELSADDCSTLFGTERSFHRLLADLWDKDGELTTTDLGSMTLTGSITGGKADLKPEFSDGESFEGVNLNKIKLVPKAGKRVEVTMRLQVKPTPAQIGRLSEWQESEVQVHVDRVQGELDLEKGEGKPRKQRAAQQQAELH